jgi:CheY-like chemotaxis protein
MNIRRKILLIDDDKDDQLTFCRCVYEIDPAIECLIANNGMEAMLHLRTINPKPSLIFLDLNMPLMNGFEYLEELKEQKIYSNIPVVIFTTSSTEEDRARCRELGVTEYLVKPTDVEVLKKKVKGFIVKHLPEAGGSAV